MTTCETIQLLDERSLARAISRSVQTLRNERYKGTGIPYVKIGRSVRYRVTDVNRFMEQNLVSTQQSSLNEEQC